MTGRWPRPCYERIVECTFDSLKPYCDAFNDVEVDVIFSDDTQTWRVPAFWSGEQRWTVRFAPPTPGNYRYRSESTDKTNPDLHGRDGQVCVRAYGGANELLRRGALRVSADRRYFEHADGTPFYWLGDTWWTGLSERLSWEGFQQLTADRKAKGFTLIQIVAGLVPAEEFAPLDAGFRNEGGAVWDAGFKSINPAYFDFADRRIEHLLSEGLVPAIVGAWNNVLGQIGVPKLKQHWRYIIARYGAYPVFWVLGGEVTDPPEDIAQAHATVYQSSIQPGWTEVARYIRATDPYHHPLTAHESPPPLDSAIRDELLTDFDMFQSSHFGWQSIAVQITQMNMHYSRSLVTKPLIQGEIGYEKLGECFFEDFQRMAFWMSMLNGAAGHTYGANGVWESYTTDKPLHRTRWSLLTWEEGMKLPGAYQVGLAAKLLRQYRWWRFTPHPEWITPRGTTLLEPQVEISAFNVGSWKLFELADSDPDAFNDLLDNQYAAGEWNDRHGNFRLPYCAGIAREVRIIYLPNFGLIRRTPPTVLGLEIGVRYLTYLWEPTTGTRIELGTVERPTPGSLIGTFRVRCAPGVMAQCNDANETDVVAVMTIPGSSTMGIIVRYYDESNYIVARYSADDRSVQILECKDGRLWATSPKAALSVNGGELRVSVEIRGDKAAASISGDGISVTTPIVTVKILGTGRVGVQSYAEEATVDWVTIELWRSPDLRSAQSFSRTLYDARGHIRGKLRGGPVQHAARYIPGWDEFGSDKHILLDAYRPEVLPFSGDWILVLDAQSGAVEH